MRIVDVIARKRDGHALTRDAIDAFVAGVTDGSVPDYQASALLMAKRCVPDSVTLGLAGGIITTLPPSMTLRPPCSRLAWRAARSFVSRSSTSAASASSVLVWVALRASS